MSDEQELQNFFSRVAGGYEKCAVEKIGYIAHERLPQRLLQLKQTQAKANSEADGNTTPLRVLDLACGTGLCSKAFFAAGCEVTGVDFAPGMIAVASQLPFTELLCQSIEEDLPLPDSSFDLVIAVGVTEFIKLPAAMFRRIQQKLKVGGLCGITLPKPSDNDQELGIISFDLSDYLKFINMDQFEILEVEEFYGWESGHLSELEGLSKPRYRIDYNALYLRKKDQS